MSEPAHKFSAVLMMAAFSRYDEALDWARDRAVETFGPVAIESDTFEFDQTDYYRSTMGPDLRKVFFTFGAPFDAADLPEVKLTTDRWEQEYAAAADHPEPRPLNIDPGYLNCKQYHAETLLGMGRVEEAVREFESTLEENYHSTSDAFVSYYVHSGQKKMAYLVAALGIRNQFAPVKDWIDAIENPNEDHSARVARFEKWGETYNLGICDMNIVAVALKQEQCFPIIDNAKLMWQPDSSWYRKTPAFKEYVNENLMAYWQENGFPSQCRALEDGDFECD